jgi:hypothetical protein
MGLWVFLLKNNEKSAKIISETKNLKKNLGVDREIRNKICIKNEFFKSKRKLLEMKNT